MIARLLPTLGVVFGSAPVLTDFGVKVLLDCTRSLRGPRAIPTGFGFIVFDYVLRFVFVPDSDLYSKCTELTRSIETVSTLPFIRISITLPVLEMTLYGPSQGWSEVVLLRFVAQNTCEHVSSSLYRKMSFCGVSRGGHNRRCNIATHSLSEKMI